MITDVMFLVVQTVQPPWRQAFVLAGVSRAAKCTALFRQNVSREHGIRLPGHVWLARKSG